MVNNQKSYNALHSFLTILLLCTLHHVQSSSFASEWHFLHSIINMYVSTIVKHICCLIILGGPTGRLNIAVNTWYKLFHNWKFMNTMAFTYKNAW